MTNNKKRGNAYELRVIKHLQPYYKEELYTTRNMSRFQDNKKIDITNENLDLNINIQTKTTASTPNYLKVLNEMPINNKPNVFINKRTKKINKNFVEEGELVIMTMEHFKLFLEKYNI